MIRSHLMNSASKVFVAGLALTFIAACSGNGVSVNNGSDAGNPSSSDNADVVNSEQGAQESGLQAPGSQASDTPTPNVTISTGSASLDALVSDAQYQSASLATSNAVLQSEQRGGAKNIILFVGDGMGITTVTAARILAGQRAGGTGEEHTLSWGKMPFAGLAKTYNVDAQTADSAGTMTAMMSGVKTDAGVIGVDESVQRGQCSSQAGNELVSALELAEIAGMSTGIISTARITHATPAATYAKTVERGWENNAGLPADAVQNGCEDIASQLVSFESRLEARYPGLDVDGMEVAMGGGRRNFLPNSDAFNSGDTDGGVEGARTDGIDLTALWRQNYPDGVYITDQGGFESINANDTTHLLGLFDASHMEYEANRVNDTAGEPSLEQMTRKAIDVLDNNDRGYFLAIESGRIDHAHHAGSAFGALSETIAFANAVEAAMQATDPANTLIIVTADHSHVFTMGGFAKRGNPILGLSTPIGGFAPSTDSDGRPFTTLGYANGLGFRNFGENTNFDRTYTVDADPGRKDLSSVDTQSSGFHQEVLVPLSSETHGGEDVGIYAQGPGASLISGTVEQNVIFHVMDFAADLVGKANQVLESR